MLPQRLCKRLLWNASQKVAYAVARYYEEVEAGNRYRLQTSAAQRPDAAQLFHCLIKPIDAQCLRPPILEMMAQHVVRRLNLGRGLSVRSRQDTECRKSVLAHGRQTKQSALLTLPTAFT